jgi:hypothetical protein
VIWIRNTRSTNTLPNNALLYINFYILLVAAERPAIKLYYSSLQMTFGSKDDAPSAATIECVAFDGFGPALFSARPQERAPYQMFGEHTSHEILLDQQDHERYRA